MCAGTGRLSPSSAACTQLGPRMCGKVRFELDILPRPRTASQAIMQPETSGRRHPATRRWPSAVEIARVECMRASAKRDVLVLRAWGLRELTVVTPSQQGIAGSSRNRLFAP